MNAIQNFFILLFLLFEINIFSQIGGTSTYEFLNLTNSARVASLGGKNISLNDNDLNLPFHNPALLTPEMSQNIVLNYVSYFAGINYGYASYALDEGVKGTFAAGMHYIDYGQFTAADEDGTITGSFTAADYALNLFYSRAIDSSFRVGVTLKPIYSVYERYSSFGIASDVGATYITPDGLLSVGAVFRNMGTQIKAYSGSNREPLPFEILLGVTKKLQYAPFRISITAQNLQRYQMSYTLPYDPNLGTTIDQSSSNNKTFADNLFRHIIAGVEFLPSKSFYISAAYNYQRRKELALQDAPGSSGYSFGCGIRLSRFSFSYGWASYTAAGGSNHFSFAVNLSKFYNN